MTFREFTCSTTLLCQGIVKQLLSSKTVLISNLHCQLLYLYPNVSKLILTFGNKFFLWTSKTYVFCLCSKYLGESDFFRDRIRRINKLTINKRSTQKKIIINFLSFRRIKTKPKIYDAPKHLFALFVAI